MDAGAHTRRDFELGLGALGLSVMAWGLTGVLIKALDMDPIAIAFWRFLVYSALLVAWMLVRVGRIDTRVLREAMPGGLLLSADVMLFFSAVHLTTIVNATTIGALQPIVIAAVATKFFGERIQGREIIAALVAIVGVVAIVTQSAGAPQWSGAGDLVALFGLFAWSGYFIAAKRASRHLTPIEFTVGTAWWVALCALPVGFLLGQDMAPPPASEWPMLLVLTLVGSVIGHTMMNWGIPRVPLWLSSTSMLLVPVGSSVAAWAFLDEPLTGWQLLAMAVVVGALAVIVIAQTGASTVAPVLPDSMVPTDR